MAVSGYQNPLEYQMYSAFENKEEDTSPVTTTSLTDTQPVATTTQQPQLPRSSLDILQSAGIQQPTRPAADILKGVGVTSAKDVLRSIYFEKPGSILEQEGISAASILEDYRKEQSAFRQQQNIANIAQKAEADLLKKEQDFIKNYKYNIPQYKEAIFETKFGKLDFSEGDYGPRLQDSLDYFSTRDPETGEWVANEVKNLETFTYNLNYGGDTFVYLPEEFVLKGKQWGDTQVYSTSFLNKEALSDLYNISQPIDASSLGKFNYDSFLEKNPSYANLQINKGLDSFGRGFLFTEQDWFDFNQKYNVSKNIKEMNTYNDPIVNRNPIAGIASYNGELVYVRPGFSEGRMTYNNIRIDQTGTANYTWVQAPKDHGGLLGVFQDVGEAVAGVPFLPEIAFLASGGNPYVYASMKALQVSGSGGEPEDVLKAAAVSYVTASVGQDLTTYGDALGSSIATASGGAISTTVANTLGNAVVNAGFNGFVAAATDQDIGDAMLTGAISGGLGRNAADITNTVFGGADNVASLSKTLNLSPAQTQRIFTGALASGAVNSIVKNQSFMDAFTESLIVQGVSQSGANAVGNSLKGTLSPKALAAIQSNTRIMLQATARAAVRGEDIDTAIARVAPYLQGRAIGQTVNILTSKKD